MHTKSQITDFPSSMPNPNNLTMQIEGNDAAVYNGGTAQTFNVTKSALGLDKVSNTADADKSVKYASSAPWIGVTDKPSTFPPSAHTHSMSQITDLGAFGGASTTAAGSAGLVPQPAAGDQDKYLSAKGTWESITGKISGTKVTSANSADKLTTARTLTIGNASKSFDGSANASWSLSEIGALPINGKASDSDKLDGLNENVFLRYRDTTTTNGDNTLWSQIGIREYDNALPDGITDGYTYGSVVSLPGIGSRFNLWYNHLTSSNGDGLRYRTGWNEEKRAWATILDSVNYNKFVPTKTGTGASGTWGINVTGNAGTVNGFTVNSDVPAGAVFTDTTYTALKNPNALSITANGKTVTYDGSSAQSISISSGGSKSVASTLLASGWQGSAAPYTYDIGSTYSDKSVMIGYDGTKYSEDSMAAASDADIVGGEGTVIYAYGEKPTVDIPIIIQYS